MPDVPWSGGPPSASELENWLVNTRNLSREDARQIAGMYTVRRTDNRWDRASLDAWVSEMVAATNEGPGNAAAVDATGDYSAVQEQAASIAAEQEARSNARNTRNSVLAGQRSQVIRDQVQGYYDQANEMAASIANSQALGMRTDAAGNPLLDESGAPMEMTPQDLWGEIKGLSFDMGSLNLPYTNLREKSRMTAISPNRTVMGTRFSQRPDQGGMSKRSLDAQAGRYSGQARRLGKGGPGGRARFRGTSRPPGGTSNLTPSQALAMLGNMSDNDLTRLQQQLYDAGLYGSGDQATQPSWGVADAITRNAFINLFMVASERDPGAPISRILADLTEENVSRFPPPESGPGAAGQQDIVPIPDFTPTVTSAAALGQTVDDIAQDLFGEFVPQDRKEALIAKLQERETAVQRTEWERSVANIREQAGAEFAMGQSMGGGGGGAPGGEREIDRFKAAISGLESGGNYNARNAGSGASGRYQIMPANWGPWATRAGLGPNAPRTPENQERVATRIMLDYYQQFGNWRDVAIAWFAGPGAVGAPGAEGRSDGNMTVRNYANSIMDRMGQTAASDPTAQSGLVETGGTQYPAIENFDPASEAAAILKAQDPVGWEAHEFANQAISFYQLLGGVGGS